MQKINKKTKVIKRYDKWSGYYDSLDSIGKGERNRRVTAIDMLDVQPDDVIIDVGTGSGFILPLIADRLSGGNVIGVDLSEKMLQKAKTRVMETGVSEKVKLQKEDIEDMKFESNTFDKVIATYTLTSVPDPSAMMRECSRILKPGGSMVILDTGPPTSRLGIPMYYWMRFSAALFGYTYINRRLNDYLPENLVMEEEKRFLATTVYCTLLKKQ